jgi:hypothetical protein
MKTLRIAVAVVISFAALGLSAGAVHAGQIGPPSLTLNIDPGSGPQGTVIAASGECFEHDDFACDGVVVTLIDPEANEVDNDQVFEDESDYALTVTVPEDGPCGEYTVLAQGIENDEVIVEEEASFIVPCGPDTTTASTVEPTSSTVETQPAAETRPTFTG